MKKIKKTVGILLVLLISIIIFVVTLNKLNIIDNVYASEYIYVLNREDKGEVLKKNHKAKAYPASLTKIMTTIVALEHIKDLSAIAPVDINSYRKMVSRNSSMAGFYAKE